jgi:hypothetical protein
MITLDQYVKDYNLKEDVCISKWSPVIDKTIGKINSYAFKRISLFCEVECIRGTDYLSKENLGFSSTSKSGDISLLHIKMNVLKDRLFKDLDYRSEVVKTKYNYLTGQIEHILEDGTHIDVDGNLIEISDSLKEKIDYLIDMILDINLYQSIFGYTFNKIDNDFMQKELESIVKKNYRKKRINGLI